MEHETYQQILDVLVAVCDSDHRSEPERQEALLSAMESVLQAMLEKLRDRFEARA
jgi:hypothetical protein